MPSLTVDFDKQGWQADAVTFLKACRRLGLTATLERSRSGRGGHLWLFFEQAVPAALARRLGSHLLTEAMEDRPDIGLDSYDRLFPNQDTLPQGGFGNLIALPLQRGPRDHGNSVFIDDDLVPWADQWAFLEGIRRIGRDEVEAIVQEAERRGRIRPVVRMRPLPTRPIDFADMALIQSLIKKGVVDDLVSDYGHVIVDECHHLSARTFESVVRQARARFVLGLSATVARKDGHHPIVTMQCGPVALSRERPSPGCRATLRALRPRTTDGVPVGAAARP